ncbi:MAG: hypothetical protein AAF415_02640 [Pseudomonadota bacterium]
MSESVRKLTVKMPWSQQLVRAEVLEVHQRPGTWVRSEDPVLTYVTQDGKQTVRSAHTGRVVPLVAPGDPLAQGDPLYVLRREPLRARPQPAPRSREGAPKTARRSFGAVWRARWERFGHWSWFVLAIGAYALAARLLIPQLQIFLGAEAPVRWIWVLAASIGAGMAFFGFMATRSGSWPRRMTWGIAACWAALSVVALSDLTDRVDLPIALRSIDPEATTESEISDIASVAPAEEAPVSLRPVAPTSEVTVAEPEFLGQQTVAFVPIPAPRGDQPSAIDEALLGDALLPARSVLPSLTDGDVIIRSGVRTGTDLSRFDSPQEAPVLLAALSYQPAGAAPQIDIVPPPALSNGATRMLLDMREPTISETAPPKAAPGLDGTTEELVLPLQLAALGQSANDSDKPLVEPLPWLPPRFAKINLLFQYLEDPRDAEPPKLGATYEAELPPEVAMAVTSSKVVEMRGMVQVTGWCIAAGDESGLKRIQTDPEVYRRVALSDRLRLLLVEVEIESDTIGMLSDALPVFGGADVGFFHNRRPMMGGWSGPQLLERGQTWMSGRRNDLIDPNYPSDVQGGAFFFSTETALNALGEQGCVDPIWQGGAPVTAMGRAVEQGMQR